MPPIDLAPPEVLSRIMQVCGDFVDVVSLASTCRRLYSIWTSESPTVIWSVGRSSIIAFDDALLAVRATDLVHQAHEQGVLPPVICIPSLNGLTRKPNLDELKKLLNMQHLVRCIMHIILSPERVITFFYFVNFDIPITDDPKLPNWKENFHLAVYRVFLAGAVLARAYQEPFYSLSEDFRQDFLHEFLINNEAARDADEIIEDNLLLFTVKDIEHLKAFPVYNFEAYDAMQFAFGPFCKWLLEDFRIKTMSRGGEIELPSPNDELTTNMRLLQREFSRFLCAYAQLCDKGDNTIFANSDGKYGYTRLSENIYERDFTENLRSVMIVLPGVFQLEEVSMPISIKDSSFNVLIADRVLQHTKGAANPLPDISTLLSYFYARSGQLNCRGGYPGPHPPLQLFEFFLRKGFNLRFADNAFVCDDDGYGYEDFRNEGMIFSDRHLDSPPLVDDEFPLPELSYKLVW